MDLSRHARIRKGGPQQHMAHGLLQRHDVPGKRILSRTLAVLEGFAKRSAPLPGAPLSRADPEHSSRSKK